LTKEHILQFDPDKFVLTKADFLKILDNIEHRWKKNTKDNWKLIIEVKTAKAFFHLKSEQSIRELWGEVIKEVNEIMIENSLAVAKSNNESWAETFEKIKTRKLSKDE